MLSLLTEEIGPLVGNEADYSAGHENDQTSGGGSVIRVHAVPASKKCGKPSGSCRSGNTHRNVRSTHIPMSMIQCRATF